MDKRFMERIARIYLETYKAKGFVAAGNYAESILGKDKELEDGVRAEVNKLLQKKGDKPSGPANRSA